MADHWDPEMSQIHWLARRPLSPIPEISHRARKIFSVLVAEFFGPSPGAIFLVAFSLSLLSLSLLHLVYGETPV